MIRVVFAEDHQALIDGVESFFEFNDDVSIIGTANDGDQLVKMVRLKQPDIVITDIRMPIMDGIQATRIIKKEFPHINVLAFTMFDQPNAVNQMLEAGAHGYILKNSGLKIMLEAIHAVANKKQYFDPNVLLNIEKEKMEEDNKIQKKGILSRREKQIMLLIADGKISSEIAEALHISKNTVETHRKNMIRKLNLSSYNELLKYAIEKKYEFQ
jgi:two-component system nitrate/nitrite response regulator NarL